MREDNYEEPGVRGVRSERNQDQSLVRGAESGSMEPGRGQKHVITNQSKQISSTGH